MTESVFVDTNVLVYRHDATDPIKQARADAWYMHLWRRRCGRLSFQVLQEMYATLTRKLKPGVAPPKAQRIVRALKAWQPIAIDFPFWSGRGACRNAIPFPGGMRSSSQPRNLARAGCS